MLTTELLRVRRSKDRLIPRYLRPEARKRLLPIAETLILHLKQAVGERREDVDKRLDAVSCGAADRPVVLGLRKLLFDRCAFSIEEGVDPIDLRKRVFELSATRRRELGARDDFDRQAVLTEIAQGCERSVETLERWLFADLKGNERLSAFKEMTADALLNRYNLALAQGVLLRATRLDIELIGESPGRVRQLFRALRFHGLLHRVKKLDNAHYAVKIDGPFSLFCAANKYGIKLAMFLPALLRCQKWKLAAEISWGKRRTPCRFALTPDDGLLVPKSAVVGIAPHVEQLLEDFAKLESPWRIRASDEIFALPDEVVCVPDLVFENDATGEQVYLEAFGFWSRHAVWQRVETMARGFPTRIILAVGKQLRVSEEVLDDDLNGKLYVYKTTMRPRAILERLEAGG